MNPCGYRSRSRRLLAIALPLLLAASLLSAPPARSAATADEAAERREARLAAAIEKTMRRYRIPGAIVGIWQPGERRFVRAFGVRDKATRKPMRTDLFMRIGSETKTFTGTAVLQLVAEGEVRLDDPISSYVPGVPNGDAITVRELGMMRSGLLSYTANEEWVKLFLGNPHRSWKPWELLPYGLSQPPLFPPDATFNYSNTNTVLLGLLVEAVSGMPLHRYVERRILRPLGMRDTRFPTTAAYPRPHADGYTEQTLSGRVANTTDWNPSWGWAAGAMISTVHDLRRWARVVATGSLLAPWVQRQRERFRPATGLAPARYGFALFDVNGWIGHNGSLPGYQSLTIYLPKAKATIVILLNSDINPAEGELTTLLGRAVTRIVTPGNVFFFSSRGQHQPGAPSRG